jgi:hypothetical protein
MEGKDIKESTDPVVSKFPEHQWWDFGQGWKNLLNNLRLVMQPYQFFNLLKPWLRVFLITHLSIGLLTLIALMNRMRCAIQRALNPNISYFLLLRVMEERYSQHDHLQWLMG